MLERATGRMKPPLDGPDGDAELVRDLGDRLAPEMVRHQQVALVHVEPVERGVEPRRLGSTSTCVGDRCLSDGDFAGAASTAKHVPAAIHDDPREPGVEPRHIAKTRKVDPGRHERFLDHVTRIRFVAQNGGGGPEGRVQPSLGQRGEGLIVTLTGKLDQARVRGTSDPRDVLHVAYGPPHDQWTSPDALAFVLMRPHAGNVLGMLIDGDAATSISYRRVHRPSLAKLQGRLRCTGLAPEVGAGLLSRSNVGDPRPTPAATPSPASWTGPVRADAATLPVVAMADGPPESEGGGGSWEDGRDSDMPWADIVEVRYIPRGGPRTSAVYIVLGERPPRAETLPVNEVISYGFVVDTDADGVADYEVGIETDAHDFGDFNVWVTDLANGVTSEKTAPPYGFPVEFMHPDEVSREMAANALEELARTMLFGFLAGSDPPGSTPAQGSTHGRS